MKSRKSERIVLQKMIRYCDEIAQILEKHHFAREDFENDMEFQFASGMCIIQIGELVAKLDEDFLKRHSGIPWRQIKGMRNIYAHDYDVIDNNMVWEAITEEIPELREKLQIILNIVCEAEKHDDRGENSISQ